MLARQQIITQCCDSYNIDIDIYILYYIQLYHLKIGSSKLASWLAGKLAEKIIQLEASYFSAVLGLIINTTNSVSFYHHTEPPGKQAGIGTKRRTFN